MQNFQPIADKTAVGMSFFCAAHCLLLPMLLVSSPGLAFLPIGDEFFHLWMLAIVIPASVYALGKGLQAHKRTSLVAFGALGISLLIIAVIGGEKAGEHFERIVTLIGASVVAFTHIVNYRLCHGARNN